MAAPASLLLPPTSRHSASHHYDTPYAHLPMRSPWMPDLLQGLDHQLQRTLLAQASACNSAALASSHAGTGPASSLGLSAASPLFLATSNLASSVPLQLQNLSSPGLASSLPFSLPEFLPVPPLLPARQFLPSSPAPQWQPAGHAHPPPPASLPPPRTMSEALARWGVTEADGGSRQQRLLSEEFCSAMIGQGSPFSASLPHQGMNASNANSQVDHHQLPLDDDFNQCRSDIFQASHVLGSSIRLAEAARGNAGDRGDEIGADILNPCSPSRWEHALSASSHWPLNVPDLSVDESGGVQGQTLVIGNATEDLQLGDFCFHQWPMLELLEADNGRGCSSSVLPSSLASQLGASGQCKEEAFLSAPSGQVSSSLEGMQSKGSPVTVLESCFLTESHSRSQSVADFSQLCAVESSGKSSSENQAGHTSGSPSTCEQHMYENGFSEDDSVQGLQYGVHSSSKCCTLPATGGAKRSRIAGCEVSAMLVASPRPEQLQIGGRGALEDSQNFDKASAPAGKRRRTVSPAGPSLKVSRKGSPAAASPPSGLPPTRTDRKKDASATPSLNNRASTASKNRTAGAAAADAGEQAVTLASRSSEKITTQALRAVAGVAAVSAECSEVKPVVPGNKRRRAVRGGSSTSPEQSFGKATGKQPPAKRSRASKASPQALVAAVAEVDAALPSAPKGSPCSERESHVIAERRRRKSMNCMLATLGCLLPADGVNPKPSDRLKIVAETITYIESLQQSLKHLSQKKTELAVAQKLLTGSNNLFADCKTRIYPSNTVASCSMRTASLGTPSPSLGGCQQELGQHEDAAATFKPMFTLDICGSEAFITLTCLRGSLQLFSKTLQLLESLRFRVLNAQKSTNSRTAYHTIHITDVEETRIKKEDLQGALQNLVNNFQS